MKVTVIYSNTRRGSTRHCVEEFLGSLSSYNDVETKDFFLPKDMPHFCRGCFSCIYNGEQSCPDSEFIYPIVKSMEESDIIILSSPVYGLDVSGQMKALIDHLCFMWVSHRPNLGMFNKVGVIFTTTAGMGLKHTVKTMKDSLNFWGIKRILVFKEAVSASKWEEVSAEKKERITKETGGLAKKVSAAAKNINRLHHRRFFVFMWTLMRGMMKKNTWNPRDRAHWETLGWLGGTSPFKK